MKSSAHEGWQSALPPREGVAARLPRTAEGERQRPVSRGGDTELHRLARARRDDHGLRHRRYLQRARGRQCSQRRHHREHGICVQGGRSESCTGDGPHGLRGHQGRDRQRAARKSHRVARQDTSRRERDRIPGRAFSEQLRLCRCSGAQECRAYDRAHPSSQFCLADLESSGAIKIVGAMYNLETGLVEFFG